MLLADHLDLLTTTRSVLAALADGAPRGVDYEAVLLDLDDLHPQVPATPVHDLSHLPRRELHARAGALLARFAGTGVHALALAVLIARLDEAWQTENERA